MAGSRWREMSGRARYDVAVYVYDLGVREVAVGPDGHVTARRSVGGDPLPQRSQFAGLLRRQSGEGVPRFRSIWRSGRRRQRLDGRFHSNRGRTRRTCGAGAGARLRLGVTRGNRRGARSAHHHGRRGRPPHLRSFRDGWRSLRFMLLYAPNWLFLLPGAALVAVGLFLVFWLLPGPRQISPRVTLDVHTMIFGVIFTLLGVQTLSIGAFAKLFSYAERFDRHGSVSLKRVLKRVTLESGLLLGGALFLTGFAGCAWITWHWAASGFGPLHEVRQVLFWAMWLFLGIQVIFASFFLSMLGISRGTYIGDYDLK